MQGHNFRKDRSRQLLLESDERKKSNVSMGGTRQKSSMGSQQQEKNTFTYRTCKLRPTELGGLRNFSDWEDIDSVGDAHNFSSPSQGPK